MNGEFIFWLVASFLANGISCQKAMLISSSLGYYNIRQVNNIVKVYQHLRRQGLQDENILLLVSEPQTCCQKNHLFGTLSFYDGEYANIFRNVEVDYFQSELTLESVASIMMVLHSKLTLNKRKLKIDPLQPLFIYITGHGGDLYFKIREREALVNEQFENIFNTNYRKGVSKKTAVISDSCSAITPFESVTTPNFIALGSSSFGEKSLSHGFDAALNQPKTDDFSFYFDQILSGKAVAKGMADIESWSFRDVQKYMDFDKLKVNSKLITNKVSRNEKISQYITKIEHVPKLHKLKRKAIPTDFFQSF